MASNMKAVKYGRHTTARSFALRSLEDATSSMALVICMVLCTLLIRSVLDAYTENFLNTRLFRIKG